MCTHAHIHTHTYIIRKHTYIRAHTYIRKHTHKCTPRRHTQIHIGTYTKIMKTFILLTNVSLQQTNSTVFQKKKLQSTCNNGLHFERKIYIYSLHKNEKKLISRRISEGASNVTINFVTATRLEPTTTQFINEHSTVQPNWPVWLNG